MHTTVFSVVRVNMRMQRKDLSVFIGYRLNAALKSLRVFSTDVSDIKGHHMRSRRSQAARRAKDCLKH